MERLSLVSGREKKEVKSLIWSNESNIYIHYATASATVSCHYDLFGFATCFECFELVINCVPVCRIHFASVL